MRERMHSFWLRLKALGRRRRLARDLEDEIAFHLAMKAEKHREEGRAAGEAESAALRRFGNRTLAGERLREEWSFPTLESVWLDVRHAVRSLRRSPGFTAVAVASIAVGIGANASVFTVLNGLFLKPLPVRASEQLRVLNWTGSRRVPVNMVSGYTEFANGAQTCGSFSYEAFRAFQERSQGFSGLSGFAWTGANVASGGQAIAVDGALVSGNFFETLGAEPLIGRGFLPAEDRAGGPPVAVIGYRLWQRLFGGDPAVLGGAIRIDQTAYTVVGVLPPGLTGLSSHFDSWDIYIPLARAGEMNRYYSLEDGRNWWVQAIARLAPGADEAQARASLEAVLAQVTMAYAGADKEVELPSVRLVDGRAGLAFRARETRRFLSMLLGLVALVLLIACANVANLLLGRGSARVRELAIRQSLGAGRVRLMRHLLTESMLLAFAGGALGFALSYAGAGLLSKMAVPREGALPVGADTRVLLFTFGLSALTALVFGIAPAVQLTRRQSAASLRHGGATASSPRQRTAKALIAVQVAAALALVLGAGLFGRTLINLAGVDLGFRAENMLVFFVDPSRNGYKDQRLIDVYDRLRAAIAAIPGVTAVGFSQNALLARGWSNSTITVPGYSPKQGERAQAAYNVVSDGFLSTMGIPILLGRGFRASDGATAPKVAVINRKLAEKYFEGNPVGRRFTMGGKEWAIVGVSGDAKYLDVRSETPPTVYLPYAQALTGGNQSMNFEVRAAVEPLSLVAEVRRAIARVDPALPATGFRTQRQQIDRTLSQERTFAALTSVFSALAVALAAIGLYAILAYSVARRTAEIGVRIALGARAGGIRWLILRESLAPVLAGIAVGLPAAFAAARAVRSILYGVEPANPAIIGIAVAVMIAAAAAAAWLPAGRAARLDPAITLRAE